MASNLKFRKVKDSDIWEIYEISNDPTVRYFSISKRPISRHEHINWFKQVDKKYFYVVEANGKVIGQIRFIEVEKNIYEVSLSVHSLWRKKGIGKYMLKQGIEELLKEKPSVQIIARVRQENTASRRLFTGFGFKESKREDGIIFYWYKKGKK